MKVVEATEPLSFSITVKHIALAVEFGRQDKKKCVVSQALRAIRDVKEVITGAAVTLVTFTNGQIVRYRTSWVLRAGLINFDRTGQWKLPVGIYQLLPPLTCQTMKYQRKANALLKVRRETEGVYHMRIIRNVAPNPRHMEFVRRERLAA